MERLTGKNTDGQWALKGECAYMALSSDTKLLIRQAIDRLAAYEDIGISAEDITDILAIMSESQDDVDDQGISIGMIHDLVELARYRETGFKPEQIANILQMCNKQSESIFDLGEKMQKRKAELAKWRKEALAYADQLGMLRFYFEKLGTNLEQVLEDCKTMF